MRSKAVLCQMQSDCSKYHACKDLQKIVVLLEIMRNESEIHLGLINAKRGFAHTNPDPISARPTVTPEPSLRCRTTGMWELREARQLWEPMAHAWEGPLVPCADYTPPLPQEDSDYSTSRRLLCMHQGTQGHVGCDSQKMSKLP